ncbi:MAG TPA: alpha/beta hydrolase [Bryobacteraceae bacterium]|jgi:acetyl esterase/lipase
MKMRFGLVALLALPVLAQLSPSASWATHAANEYQVYPNVTYLTMGGVELKMDVYKRRTATAPQPTIVYMHGGFWVAGNKEGAIMNLLPWMEMGWNVVNVEYRLGAAALAPAAVEDCFCAMRFLAAQQQSTTYNIDPSRIVVTGESAGGHLALAMGTIPASEGLDRECAGAALPKVAMVINWFGIADVPDVIDGPHKADAAVRWFGSLPNRMEIARRVSPLTYVRTGLPPILTIHGDADPTVPYQEAVRLHEALAKVNVPNQLLTVPGGKHGNFTPEQRDRIYLTIREFLAKNGLGPK